MNICVKPIQKLFLFLFMFFSISLFSLSFATKAQAADMCTWRSASVFEGNWLECKDCVWRYCQCQPGGRWGNCTNTDPKQSCDWSNPDWTNPACGEGGFMPCDWHHPDFANPSCNIMHPGGVPASGDCAKCHPNGMPTLTVNPGQNADALLAMGVLIYERTCATCHGPLATSPKKGRTAAQIESAKIFHPDVPTWPTGFRSAALEMALSPTGASTLPQEAINWTGGKKPKTNSPPDWTGGKPQMPDNGGWSSAGIKEGQDYALKSKNSGKCLDLKDKNAANGTIYQQWACNEEPQQTFRFIARDNGSYNIVNNLSKRCISVVRGELENGVNLHSWDCLDNPDQRLVPIRNDFAGTWSFRFEHSGKCADVQGKGTENGLVVHQWECVSSAPDQAWQLIPVD